MAVGDIVRGGGGMPLYGSRGTILYYDGVKPSINLDITIAWSDGNDVDIACFWTDKSGMIVGWSWDYGGTGQTTRKDDGPYGVKWDGDNTSGGPEHVHAIYANGKLDLSKLTFQVHCNWYSKGEDHTGGNITVSAGGRSCSLVASDRKGSKAEPGDPGAIIRFDRNGNVTSITQW